MITWRIPAGILQTVSVGSALIHAWTCAFGDPACQDILVRKGDTVDLMPIQVAGAHFSGMGRGTYHKVGESSSLLRDWHTSESQGGIAGEVVDVLPVLPFVDGA